jgi:hypothetical protein
MLQFLYLFILYYLIYIIDLYLGHAPFAKVFLQVWASRLGYSLKIPTLKPFLKTKFENYGCMFGACRLPLRFGATATIPHAKYEKFEINQSYK